MRISLAVVLVLGLAGNVSGDHVPWHSGAEQILSDVEHSPRDHIGATFTLAHATSSYWNYENDNAFATIDFVPGGVELAARTRGSVTTATASIALDFTTSEPLLADFLLYGPLARLEFSGPGIAIDRPRAYPSPFENGCTHQGTCTVHPVPPMLLEPGEYRFRLNITGPDGSQNGYFNMSLVNPAAIPEPSTWIAAAMSLLVLFAVRRHRRASGH